jgi:WhiB family redox-sensing transcriptional regulator
LKSMDLYSESAPFDGTQSCMSVDPEMFFPEDYEDRGVTERAKSICKSCPLTLDCLEYAMSDASLDGIWGGTTPRERKNMRRRKRVPV